VDHLWSSDGQQLVVALRQEQNLVLQIVPALFAGPPRQVLPLPWSHHDVSVRFLRIVGRNVYAEVTDPIRNVASLQRVDLDRGSVTNLSNSWTTAGRIRSLDISPDGTRVTYTAFAAGHEDLWVASVDGSSAKQLTRDASFARSPLWSGTGTSIIYQSNRGGQIDLWEISPDSGLTQQLTSGRDAENPESVSTDGSLITFTQLSEEAHLWRWETATRSAMQLTQDALNDFSPVPARGGSSIVFQRTQPSPIGTAVNGTVLLGSLDASGLQPAPRIVADGFAASISPDQSAVAYLQRGPDPGATLKITKIRTNETVTVSSACSRPVYSTFPNVNFEWASQTLAWNPETSELYFVDGLNRRTLRRYQSAATLPAPALVTLTSEGVIRDVRASSDGRTLAYVVWSGSSRLSTVHVIDITTGKSRELARLDGDAYARGWLASGSDLVIVRAGTYSDDFTSDIDVLTLSADGKIRQAGRISRAFIASTRFDPGRALVYATQSNAGVHNLVSFSLTNHALYRITENTLPGVSFSGIQPLANGSIIGVRSDHKQDIWIMEAEPKRPDGSRTAGR
jgi:Tol biopolymer transport system component